MARIPLTGPSITALEERYVTDAVRNAWYADSQMYNDRFEAAFAEAVGRRHAVSLPSCTSGIHLSLLALGVGPGDEVIVPDVTWIASAAPIHYVGATPVFADIAEDSWCLCAESFEACITERTRAVIFVGLYGNLPDVPRILEVAKRHGVAVIEDAAEAIGSAWDGRPAGSFGDTSVFSFHGSKTITTGEGGMLVTDSDDLHERVQVLRDHGRPRGDRHFNNSEVAYKYKMSSLQAALGLAQLERLDELVGRKREIFAGYARHFADVEGITLLAERAPRHYSYWLTTALVDPQLGHGKDRLLAVMSDAGIDCRPFFRPLSSLAAYAETPGVVEAAARNHRSYAISPYGLCLPSGMDLDDASVARVAETLTRSLELESPVSS